MADDIVLPIPNLALPQHLFVLSNNAFQDEYPDACSKLLDGIRTDHGPYYRSITSTPPAFPPDKGLLDSLEKVNEDELKILDERLAEAEKIEGESEISDALKARANYVTKADSVMMR